MNSELYKEYILTYAENTYTEELSEVYSYKSKQYNPTCGDDVELRILINDNKEIEDISYKVVGCLISRASLAILDELLINKSLIDGYGYYIYIYNMMHKENVPSNKIEELELLRSVSDYSARIKCVLLAWIAFKDIYLISTTN